MNEAIGLGEIKYRFIYRMGKGDLKSHCLLCAYVVKKEYELLLNHIVTKSECGCWIRRKIEISIHLSDRRKRLKSHYLLCAYVVKNQEDQMLLNHIVT